MIRSEPEGLFVFGDNLERWGLGGQAKEMRGEPNAVGIPTKRSPRAYLCNEDLDEWIAATKEDVEKLHSHTGIVVWPKDGIGTGLAQLAVRAPVIYDKIRKLESSLVNMRE